MTRDEIKLVVINELLLDWNDGDLDETNFLVSDLGMDSLDILDLAVKAENHFSIVIDIYDDRDDDLFEMTVGQLIDLIDKKVHSSVG